MKVLVDTCVWSLALRRKRSATADKRISNRLAELIEQMRAVMCGPVRQELLSGIRTPEQFALLRERLRAFPDLEIRTEDHETAAAMFNRCRAAGLQGSNTDFLLCALAERHGLAIFTADQDFEHYRRVLGTTLMQTRDQPHSPA
jgi:predicted nucleic acid-binding protein